jgi:hypothetical protein
MKGYRIVISSLAATSMMTMFSYFISESNRRNFKEPQLLGVLLKEALPNSKKNLAITAGWVTHYTVGLVWALAYSYLFEKSRKQPDFKDGLVLGGLSGLIGAGVWKLAFRIHPNPPEIAFDKFYRHLLLAHLVYMLSLIREIREI